MITLGYLAAAGLMLGMFFNGYALAASCTAIALAHFISAFDVGIAQAGMSLVGCLVLHQTGYFVGLSASVLLYRAKAIYIPTSRR